MMLVDSTNKKLEKVIHISYLVLILHIIICLVVFSKLENDFIILRSRTLENRPFLADNFFYDFLNF